MYKNVEKLNPIANVAIKFGTVICIRNSANNFHSVQI